MISKTPAGGGFRTSFRDAVDYLKRGKGNAEPTVNPDPGFRASLDYLKQGTTESAHDRTDWIATRNLGPIDPEKAPEVMRGTAARGDTDRPVYHRIISLAEGERLSREQMEHVADEVLKGLGLSEHQVLIAQHSDNGKQHIHLIVNRVHPETGRIWDASHDYVKTERVLRRLENELGLRRVQGRHWAEPGQARYRGTRKAQEPFAQRARGLVGDVLAKSGSWQELHTGLSQHGLSIEPDKRNRGLVLTDGSSWTKASSVSRSASRPALEKRFGPFEAPDRGLDRMREQARRHGSWKAVERELLQQPAQVQEKWGVSTAYDRLRQYCGALNAELAGTYRNPTVARRRIERALHTHGWRDLRRDLHARPESFGKLHGGQRANRRSKEARINAARLEDAVRRFRVAERSAARSDFARSVREKTSGVFAQAKSWDELHAALRRDRLRLCLASTGKALLVTDGRAAVPTFQLEKKFGKKPLEKRLGAFAPSSHALDRLAEVTRQLLMRERLERLLSRHRHRGLEAKAEMRKLEIAKRDLHKAQRSLEETTAKVYREPTSALRAIDRHEQRHGARSARLATSETPQRFGRLHGGRVIASQERQAAIQQAALHLPYRLHDVQVAKRHLAQVERAQPAAWRALQRSRRAVQRLQTIGAKLAPHEQLTRQAARLVHNTGWAVAARLLPAPHYQVLRISVSLARKGATELARTIGRGS